MHARTFTSPRVYVSILPLHSLTYTRQAQWTLDNTVESFPKQVHISLEKMKTPWKLFKVFLAIKSGFFFLNNFLIDAWSSETSGPQNVKWRRSRWTSRKLNTLASFIGATPPNRLYMNFNIDPMINGVNVAFGHRLRYEWNFLYIFFVFAGIRKWDPQIGATASRWWRGTDNMSRQIRSKCLL